MIKIILILAFINYLLYFLNGRKKTNLALCGLIGYSGQENYNIDKIRFLMLWNSVERGKDATGIYTPSTGLIKDNEPAGKFLFQSHFKKLVDDNQLIAHVRAKTIGANLVKNAHPFDEENIVLAHNGTLVDYVALASKYDMKALNWDVDSQVLSFGINRAFNAETTLDNLNIETLSEYKGAAALLFYSKNLDMIFVFKDKERPLFYGYDLDGGMYMSSIEESLKAAGLFEIKAFTDNTLYAIDHGEIVKTWVYKTYAELNKTAYVGKVRGREPGQRFPKLKKGERGIDITNGTTKAYWFLDMWLYSNTQTWNHQRGIYGKFAEMKTGRFYLVTGFYAEDIMFVQVKDENGNDGMAALSSFDIDRCIPQPEQLFRITAPLVAKKTKQKLWEKGQIVELMSYDITEGSVSFWSDSENAEYEIPMKCCKPLTPQEVIDFCLETEDPKDKGTKEPLLIQPAPEPSPFIENTPEPEPLGDFISTPVFLGALELIESGLGKLEEKYDENGDLTPEINAIRMDITNCKDKTYLDNLLVHN